ncbi:MULTISPECIES: class I SAM-dependent methyltransferase [Breznakia]|uniref:tRNA (Adenine22-N1)-methyltransferase n=1 Tax=Breznakia blatticola TaxID=1754012 RepID=A0A4V3G952_9FIRM|nr:MULTISPECIES: class I SAM-dependent methyltransferase [Breznakia]MDH6366775.1 tRNA (adenine22-N1)-methyltransferase [Breznakia sp. PH1-1]MDH6403838.1 tRNA (adenine22-N1)-methyltransferase [Breznakia sp. PF1-11]MDH6411547.1 tRNA (adenine22-N1)-methyltransferase [Breznakia sp. PFB1-11]MDH6413911.1 tRNA (adenine22-N1)-methyltransferase [Breznakia sp. PFB1-14]MDH6416340.1 tRNA (adenine22-N1)-methyltransferase [Breznakia sp. PFB1-4]
MKISKRLQAIADFVDQDAIIADIGCDHAQLACALVNDGIAKKAYACDIGREPLEAAKKTIERSECTDKVEAILCDGLELVPADADIFIIAGMGFETIKHILENSEDKLKQARKIIIQSNKDVEKLRMFISEKRYHIQEEVVVHDHHYYQILVFDVACDEPLSNDEIMFGRRMVKNSVFHQFWFSQLKKFEEIYAGMEKEGSKKQAIGEIIERIQKEIGV